MIGCTNQKFLKFLKIFIVLEGTPNGHQAKGQIWRRRQNDAGARAGCEEAGVRGLAAFRVRGRACMAADVAEPSLFTLSPQAG
jgi:hypothetical protein